MAFNQAAVQALFDALVSHAETLGIFDRVNTHEPKVAPGRGLSCSFWVDTVEPVQTSGLAATSGRIAFHVRLQTSFISKPEDGIDPALLTAVCVLLNEYSGSFTLGGIARDVDLLGQHGTALSAQAGFLTQGERLYRVMAITLPIVINDLFAQVA